MKDSEKAKLLYEIFVEEARQAHRCLSNAISDSRSAQSQYSSWHNDDPSGGLGFSDPNPYAQARSQSEKKQKEAEEEYEKWKEMLKFIIDRFCKEFDVTSEKE